MFKVLRLGCLRPPQHYMSITFIIVPLFRGGQVLLVEVTIENHRPAAGLSIRGGTRYFYPVHLKNINSPTAVSH